MIKQFMSATIPKVRIKSYKSSPWFDSDLRHLQHVKMTAWRKPKRSKKSDWAKFKKSRNQFKKDLVNKYDNFINDLSQKNATVQEKKLTYSTIISNLFSLLTLLLLI